MHCTRLSILSILRLVLVHRIPYSVRSSTGMRQKEINTVVIISDRLCGIPSTVITIVFLSKEIVACEAAH